MKIDEDLILNSDGTVTGTVNPVVLKYSPDEYRKNFNLYKDLCQENYDNKNIIGGLFVFILCPYSSIPSFPIHIYLSSNGLADDMVSKKVKQICEKLKTFNVHIPIFSSDGDSHYREEFNNQFDFISRTFEFDPNFNEFSIPELTFSNDLSHLPKRGRKRLVKKGCLFISKNDQKLYLEKDQKAKIVSIELVKSFDRSLTDCYFRNNSHDAMDDFYPNAIFNGKSLKGALEEGNWPVVLYLLPMTCMNRILRDKYANRRQRAIWSYIGMFIMFFYWSGLKLQMNTKNKELKRENFDSIFSLDFCVDCFNGFFAILLSILKIPNSCSISCIGTIHSEHFFASLRNKAGKEQTIKKLMWAFDRLIQFKKWNYFEDKKISRRLFETGILEEGCFRLSEEEVKNCELFAAKLFLSCEQNFPKNSAAFNLVQDIEETTDLNEWDLNIIGSLTNDNTFEIKAKQTKWELRVSKFRLTNKAGRNIISRYITKINTK